MEREKGGVGKSTVMTDGGISFASDIYNWEANKRGGGRLGNLKGSGLGRGRPLTFVVQVTWVGSAGGIVEARAFKGVGRWSGYIH